MRSAGFNHVPSEPGQQQNRQQTANDSANDFSLAVFQGFAETRAKLAADDPAHDSANDEGEKIQHWRRKEQNGISIQNGRGETDGKQSTDSARYCASQCA